MDKASALSVDKRSKEYRVDRLVIELQIIEFKGMQAEKQP